VSCGTPEFERASATGSVGPRPGRSAVGVHEGRLIAMEPRSSSAPLNRDAGASVEGEATLGDGSSSAGRYGVCGARTSRGVSRIAREGRPSTASLGGGAPSSTALRSLLALLALTSSTALAHKGSDALWTLTANGSVVEGRIDVALDDVEQAVGLDGDGNGDVTWGEVRTREAFTRPWLKRGLQVKQAEGGCSIELGEVSLVRHSDGVYGAWPFLARCPAAVTALSLDYALLFDVDAQHRGLVRVTGASGGQWRAFSASERHLEVDLSALPPFKQVQVAFFEGVHHLAIGVDHLCFLFALLLPSVLRREGRAWAPVETLKGTLLEVTKVVTAFTLAHSVTLGLSAFGVLAPDPGLVEVAIAVSVLLAALNTVFPLVTEGRWVLAFGLGLLHGFGFVSALTDLGEKGGQLWLSLLGFNLGVEAGQLLVVALVVPVAFALRRWPLYARAVVPVGGVLLVALAAWWTVERLSGV
jgi:hypothetical protein